MAGAIVRGMSTLAEVPASSIILSPRGAAKVAKLAADFPGVLKVAASNQEVVDSSDIVFIGCLPAQAEEVIGALKFSSHHTVVSLVATMPMAKVQEACAPVPNSQVLRVIPLPPVAKHAGATVMTPKHPIVTPLFDQLGPCVACEDEATMKKMMVVTCLMGQFYAQQRATQQWLERQGIGTEAASKWTGAVFHSISYDSAIATPHTFEELVGEQVKGGLNEQVIRELTEAGAFSALSDSLDGCLARFEGRARPNLRKRPYSSTVDDK